MEFSKTSRVGPMFDLGEDTVLWTRTQLVAPVTPFRIGLTSPKVRMMRHHWVWTTLHISLDDWFDLTRRFSVYTLTTFLSLFSHYTSSLPFLTPFLSIFTAYFPNPLSQSSFSLQILLYFLTQFSFLFYHCTFLFHFSLPFHSVSSSQLSYCTLLHFLSISLFTLSIHFLIPHSASTFSLCFVTLAFLSILSFTFSCNFSFIFLSPTFH